MSVSQSFHFEWIKMRVQTKPNASQPNMWMQRKLLSERSWVSLRKSFHHETRWHMSMSSQYHTELKSMSLQGELHRCLRIMQLSWRVYFWAVKVFLSIKSIHLVKRVHWVFCLVFGMHRKWIWVLFIQLGFLLFADRRWTCFDKYCLFGC